jgi:hypothetical protein
MGGSMPNIFPKRSQEPAPAPSSQVTVVANATNLEKIYLLIFFAAFAIMFVGASYVSCKISRDRKKAKRELQRKLITAGVDLYVKKKEERAESGR